MFLISAFHTISPLFEYFVEYIYALVVFEWHFDFLRGWLGFSRSVTFFDCYRRLHLMLQPLNVKP